MTLQITIDRTQHLAVYKQIAEQIKTQISAGELAAGTRLPTVRQLAQQLGITRLTSHNAYGELQAEGWIEAVVGRGTFVSQAVKATPFLDSADSLLTPDYILKNMFHYDKMVGIRSLAMAYPDESTFPLDEFWGSINALRHANSDPFQYNHPLGDEGLRHTLAKWLERYRIWASVSNILVVNGTMQALSLVAQAFTHAGDYVLVEQPTFLGIINTLEVRGVHAIGVPVLDDGVDLVALELALQTYRPRLYFTIPNFHNPTGRSMSLAKRHHLLALAKRYDCLIVEDDVYGELYYDEPPPPRLKALDLTQQVIYIGGFSKILMPGLRIGFIYADTPLMKPLVRLRLAHDLGNPPFLQQALHHFMQDDGLVRHLKRMRPLYAERRDALLAALDEFMPDGVRWTQPMGGFTTWVQFPRLFADGELYHLALQNGVAFTPGEAYRLPNHTHEYFRLCFGNQTTVALRAGVRQLSVLIRDRMHHTQHHVNPLH